MLTSRTVLTNATLIDCVNPKPAANTSVVIEKGRIAEILTGGRKPATGDSTVIDLKGAYLMPGLWDVHIHPDYLSLADMPLAEQVALFGHRLMQALTESGITGLRCAGAHHFMDVAWKRAFDSGQHIGPRVFAAGHFLTTTGGHFLTSGHALECDGPYGFVKAIREQIKNGVDHIKLNLSGGIMGPAWDLHKHSFLLEDELKAAFDICKKREFKVMAHATNPEAVKAAIRMGAHTIEHRNRLEHHAGNKFGDVDEFAIEEDCVKLLADFGDDALDGVAEREVDSIRRISRDGDGGFHLSAGVKKLPCLDGKAPGLIALAIEVRRRRSEAPETAEIAARLLQKLLAFLPVSACGGDGRQRFRADFQILPAGPLDVVKRLANERVIFQRKVHGALECHLAAQGRAGFFRSSRWARQPCRQQEQKAAHYCGQCGNIFS